MDTTISGYCSPFSSTSSRRAHAVDILYTYSKRGQSLKVASWDMLMKEESWGGARRQRGGLRGERNHLSLGNVLLDTRLERCFAGVDRDLFAIGGKTSYVLCVRRHCKMW